MSGSKNQNNDDSSKENLTLNSESLKCLLFVCGLSGAGRSTALAALADQGFYVNENLPVELCESMLSLAKSRQANTQRTAFSRMALAPDLADDQSVQSCLSLISKLRQENSITRLLFLDCRAEVIVKRYGQTRRPHPNFSVHLDSSLDDAILRERNRLQGLRDSANLVLDTSELNIHELRRDINSFASSLSNDLSNKVRVNLVSFGFKYGIPNDCDLVTDVRFLTNPYFIPELKNKTGLEKEVQDFVSSRDGYKDFLDISCKHFCFLIQKHAKSGKLYINIGVGCTGGQHRSVVIATKLSQMLKDQLEPAQFSIGLRNRDILKAI